MAKNKARVEQDDGSYVVRKTRRSSILAFVVCLLLAVFIWAYAEADEKQREAALSEAVESVAESAAESAADSAAESVKNS